MSIKTIFSKKTIIKALVFIFIVAVLFNIFFNFFIITEYSDKIFSSDKIYYAQIAEKNSGSSTSPYTVVRIINTRSVLSYFGALSAWSGDRKSVFAFKGGLSSVQITWLGNRSLKITYSDCRQIYGKDESWRDVKIIYEVICSENN